MKNTFLPAIIALFFGVSANAQSTVDSITAKYKLLPMPAPLTVDKTFPVLGAYVLNNGAPATAPVATTQSTNVNQSASTTQSTTGTTQTDSAAATTTTTTDASAGVAPTEATPSVAITLDSVNKGIIWVDGLPEGRFKAYLKKSPTTYRILAQKTNLGKQIPEGTLYYDVTTNALNIAIGKPYNEEDPIGIFGINAPATTDAAVATNTTAKSKSSKSKSKVTFYTASKVMAQPATETEAQGGGTTTQDQQ